MDPEIHDINDLAPEAGANTDPKGGGGERTAAARVLRTPAMVRSIQLEIQDAILDRAEGEEDAEPTRTVELAVSSEFEVRREWPFEGLEILDHRPGAVRLDRFKDGAAVIAGDHFGGDLVGATEDAWLKDRRLWVRAKFASVEDAERELTLIREGIRRNVSIRYRIHTLEHTRGAQGAPDVFRATDWEPVHVALVNDPEDPTVGFGREAKDEVSTTVVDLNPEPAVAELDNPEEGRTMTDKTPAAEPKATAAVDRAALEADAREAEANRTKEIMALGRQFNVADQALEAIQDGSTVLEFKDRILDSVKPGQPLEATNNPAHLDMEERDANRFSLFRALRYLENPGDRKLADEAGLELEASRAIAKATGESPRGLFIPTDILGRQMDLRGVREKGLTAHMTHGAHAERALGMTRADMGATLATTGQELVGTDHLGASFIDVLRNTSAILPRCTTLSGLQGNVEIPKKTVPTAGAWVATEGADTAADDMTIAQETLTAKDVGAHVIVRRRLLLQSSPDIENMTRMDLAIAIALAIDAGTITGTGAGGAPTGFLNDGGIGDSPLGAAAADPAWSNVVSLWKLVAEGNGLSGNLGWLMGAAHAAHFMQKSKDGGSGRFIMEGPSSGIMGYQTVISEQMAADSVAFLDFSTIVAGFWGGLDLLVDPYSQSKSASIVIRAIQTCDTVVRQEAKIAAWQDSTVT